MLRFQAAEGLYQRVADLLKRTVKLDSENLLGGFQAACPTYEVKANDKLPVADGAAIDYSRPSSRLTIAGVSST